MENKEDISKKMEDKDDDFENSYFYRNTGRRIDTILDQLISDYEKLRIKFTEAKLEGTKERALQGMANALVLIQTALNNCNLYSAYIYKKRS